MTTEQHIAARTIIKSCLNNATYERIKNHIPEEIFRPALKAIFKTVCEAQELFGRDVSMDELKALHEAKNPSMSKTQKDNLGLLFRNIEEVDEYGEDIAEHLLRMAYGEVIGDKLVDVALKLKDNPGENVETVEELRGVFDEACRVLINGDEEENLLVEVTLQELADQDQPENVKLVNIPKFNDVAPYIPDALFVILGARPNTGKTSFLGTLTAAPNGFMDQGFKTMFCLNEEAVARVIRRHLTIRSNTDWEIIKRDLDSYQHYIDELMTTNKYVDVSGGKTLMTIERYLDKYEPDILVTDILDKVGMPGIYQREDLKLEALYRAYRDIGKKYNIPVIGCSQVGDEGSDRLILTASMLKDSRTGKYAEADAIWLIGRGPSDQNKPDADDPQRCINIGKDKIHAKDGYHRYIQLPDARIGRFTG